MNDNDQKNTILFFVLSAVVVSAEGELPATFVFKTRDGAIGVGQIVEMDRGGADEHGTMKVRFKLIQVSGK